jgi:pyruvate,orthophosphate dikinase
VTIRLLDPPLHEFLPHADAEFAELSETIGIGVETLKRRAAELHEFNPMLGHRGCRLGITFPEIYEMQVRAIFEAACDVAAASDQAPVPEVMIPLVATRKRTGDPEGAGRPRGGGGVRREGPHARISGWHDDRIAARCADGR